MEDPRRLVLRDKFQFPMGISRSCYSDLDYAILTDLRAFQFPMGISRSCYEKDALIEEQKAIMFQFPMGISRSCYSTPRKPLVARGLDTKIAHPPIPADLLPDPVSSAGPIFLSSCGSA